MTRPIDVPANEVGERTGARAWVQRGLQPVVDRAWLSVAIPMTLTYFERLAKGKVLHLDRLQRHLDDGCVLAFNHGSYLDWMIVWAWFHRRLGRDITFIGKDALFHHPVWRPFMELCGVVRVSDEGNRFLDKEGYRRIRHAKCVGIFPEATRTPNGLLQPAKSGVIKLALRLRRPILPVALCGFYDAWPRHRRLPRIPAPSCSIVIGEPWAPDVIEPDMDETVYFEAQTQRLMSELAALLGQPHAR